MASVDDVRRLALSLPETVEKPSYGSPGFRVKDKLFARIRDDGESLLVYVGDLGEKEALLRSDDDVLFTEPHYDGHPTVLVRISEIDVQDLEDYLIDSWRLRAPKRVLAAYDAAHSEPET